MTTAPRLDREMSTRDTEDREWDELSFSEFRDPNNLDYMTPPPKSGEHLRWVATGPKNVGKERSRASVGFRPVRFQDYPEFRPYKMLLASGSVQPDDAVSNGHDLTLMRIPARYAEARDAFMANKSRDLVQGVHSQHLARAEHGVLMVEESEPTKTNIERRRRPGRQASFG